MPLPAARLAALLAAFPVLAAAAEPAGPSKPRPEPVAPPAKAEPGNPARIQVGPVTVEAVADLRDRLETRVNYDFDSAADSQTAFNFLRTRLGAKATAGALTLHLDALDAREMVTPADKRANQDPLDLHQVFLEWRPELAGAKLKLKAGRQELNFGSQSLVCSSGWANLTRTYDALRVGAERGNWVLDAFAGRTDVVQEGFDEWKGLEELWGVYFDAKALPGATLGLFVVGQHAQVYADPARPILGEDGAPGPLHRITPGLRLKGAWLEKKLEADVELAYQAGARAYDSIQAYAGWANVGYLLPLPYETRVKARLAYASGDQDPGDGRHQTFNPLYGTNHDPYGQMDFLRLQNLQDAGLAASAKPHKLVEVTLEYHALWLAEQRDNWVSASGAVLRKANPQASKFLGQEVSLRAAWAPVNHLKVEGGAALFAPGAFVEATGPADTAAWTYLQVAAAL